MRVWVHWEPRAGAVVAWESWIWEDFIDGAGWMLLEGWGQVPELAWGDGPVWGGLWVALGGLVRAVLGGQWGNVRLSSSVVHYVDHLP